MNCKCVMRVEMYGRTIIVRYTPGQAYEYKVYELFANRNPYHLGSFEAFQEALEFVTKELY